MQRVQSINSPLVSIEDVFRVLGALILPRLDYISSAELARLSGRHHNNVLLLCRQGILPATQSPTSGYWLILRADALLLPPSKSKVRTPDPEWLKQCEQAQELQRQLRDGRLAQALKGTT